MEKLMTSCTVYQGNFQGNTPDCYPFIMYISSDLYLMSKLLPV